MTTLAAGARLGPYRILSALDGGGVGELYRARDEERQRDAAIRVLRADFAADPDRLRRVQQDVQAALTLAHPAILTVYEVGTDAGAAYVVSEPLGGETLREALNRGALPVRSVIEYAVQLAHGLAAAHDKGVVHRDLKPENILVTADGRVKILGFGLAMLTQVESGLAGLKGVTAMLGSPSYMSPEQARGLTPDPRFDMFAFGAILYEMLSGARAFSGDTPVDTMTAVLKSEPPPLPVAERQIPPILAGIVDRCLKKNPAPRVSAGDVAIALDGLWSQAVPAAAVAQVPAGGRRLARVVAALVVLALAVAIAPAAIRLLRGARTRPAASPEATAPLENVAALTAPSRPVGYFALSPDGRRLAFTAAGQSGQQQLWIRLLTTGTEQPLANTEGASFPFWSPDGRFVAFVAQRTLQKIDAAGGTPVVLADATASSPGAWSQDDTILFQRDANGPLHRVSAAGGALSPVTTVMSGEPGHAWPVFLPRGRRFLYSVRSAAGEGPRVFAGSIESMTRTPVLSNASHVAYAGGHLFFLRGNALMAQRFEVDDLEVLGDVVQIGEQVRSGPEATSVAAFSAAEAGVLAYQTTAPSDPERSHLVWFDRAGTEVGRLGEPADYGDLSWSPDGTRLAVSVRERGGEAGDIWVFDVAQGTRMPLISDLADEMAPVWSPDSRRIAFASARKGTYDLYQKGISGTGNEAVLVEAAGDQISDDWSPDGRFLLFQTNQPSVAAGGNMDLWARPMPDGRPFAFLRTVHAASRAKFSPDARWVAYTSREGGREDVYVSRFPRLDGRRRISARGGSWVRWRRDGSEIFYLAPDNRLMAVPMKDGRSGFETGPARPLFQTRAKPNRGYAYEVSGDGQRFLINAVGDGAAAETTQRVTLVDWRAVVKR